MKAVSCQQEAPGADLYIDVKQDMCEAHVKTESVPALKRQT